MARRPLTGVRSIGGHGDYEPIWFLVPAAVRSAARRGLALREAWGRGGTPVGIARARQLVLGEITLRDAVVMRAWFARHARDRIHDFNPPSAGAIAWLLWGGDPGREYVERVYESHVAGPSARGERRPWL